MGKEEWSFFVFEKIELKNNKHEFDHDKQRILRGLFFASKNKGRKKRIFFYSKPRLPRKSSLKIR